MKSEDHNDVHPDQAEGARNLLLNCVQAVPGQDLLIVGEDGPNAHFDPATCSVVADVARSLGMTARVIIAPETRGKEDFPLQVSGAMAVADETIFFTRLGDQVRFCPTPGPGGKTVCYALDPGYLGARFGRTDFRMMKAIEEKLVARIAAAREYRITCPDGSDLVGRLDALEPDQDAMTPFSVTLFPVMIFAPVTCARMSGKLVLKHWLTSSSTNVYEGSVMHLPSPVVAQIRNGEITGFDGDAELVRRVTAQFERVGAMAGGNPFAVNSWHTGINPNTYYSGRATDDLERWGTVAYGSPRYTHFHACGADPGDIAFTMIDATISFDGKTLWRDGVFSFIDDPEVRALREQFPCSGEPFEMRRDIGL